MHLHIKNRNMSHIIEPANDIPDYLLLEDINKTAACMYVSPDIKREKGVSLREPKTTAQTKKKSIKLYLWTCYNRR
jgi:hypothetical protein